MEETGIRYVGIDLAKRSFVGRIEFPDEAKAVVFHGKTDNAGIDKLMARLRPTDRVGMECCAYAFHLAKELTRRVGCEVFVLNAGQLAIIYKSTKKTDLEDAAKNRLAPETVSRERTTRGRGADGARGTSASRCERAFLQETATESVDQSFA